MLLHLREGTKYCDQRFCMPVYIYLFDQKSHPNLTIFFVNVLSVFAAQSFSRDTADDVMCLHNGHMQIASRNNSLAVEVNMHNE